MQPIFEIYLKDSHFLVFLQTFSLFFADFSLKTSSFPKNFVILHFGYGRENDIAQLLAQLHTLAGAEYSRQVERIAHRNEFRPVENETGIYSCGGETGSDFENLLAAARKAVAHGYKVYILPNPKGFRTADFIFERKGTYKMYDLKTIQGRSSAINRLQESVGQCNRVVLNMTTEYNTRALAFEIKHYFETNAEALEVLVLKRGKSISIDRYLACSPSFFRIFKKSYERFR